MRDAFRILTVLAAACLQITAYDADVHSVAADPLFVDTEGGNFRLQDKSPAFALGFQRIPPIRTPSAVCGDDAMIECLSLVMPK